MTREQACGRLDEIAAALEADLGRAQTRDQHISISQRLAEVRALRAELSAAPAA